MSIATQQYKSNIACQKIARQVINSLMRRNLPFSFIAEKSKGEVTSKRIDEIKRKDTDIAARELGFLLGFYMTIGRSRSKLIFKKFR